MKKIQFKLSDDIVLQELAANKGKYWCFNTSNGDCFRLNVTSYKFLNYFINSISFQDAYNNLLDNFIEISDQTYKEIEEIFNYCLKENVIYKI